MILAIGAQKAFVLRQGLARQNVCWLCLLCATSDALLITALVGAVSTQFTDPTLKIAFGVGAVLASYVFFFSLGYGARLLTPIMQSATAWGRLDVLIGIVMWALAVKLIS